MKKAIAAIGGIVLSLLSVSVNAQQTWDAKKNPTVDSIAALYRDKIVTAPPAPTKEDIFPAIGKYASTVNADAAHIIVTLDDQNKGLVWIEGLPQGKIKAMLRKSPATYKIPVQKTAEGNDVAEGTLIFEKETNTLSICIGKTYNAETPSAAFATPVEEPATIVKNSKVKKPVQPKTWIYTGTKLAKETAMN